MCLLLKKSSDFKQGKEGEIKSLFKTTDRLARSDTVYILGMLINKCFRVN